ncbi:hypothetical protein EJG51_013020 [Undibacterium piscinae]|uniref:Uncharacterized protein n=1 Tax=Undibacterium piscinae TaxID=2495591 RepID=A0A6M4A995_9BURK|nr:hypothetical protein EJG51_013020 [Undibacterium piscinae]
MGKQNFLKFFIGMHSKAHIRCGLQANIVPAGAWGLRSRIEDLESFHDMRYHAMLRFSDVS